jgi:hypothetical protein
MSLTFRKKLNEIVESDHFGVIQIKTSPVIFHKRFFGVSSFFKSLKNGLYSINKIPNRTYFRGLSGVYMSLEMDSNLEIIILYDLTITPLNSLQVKTRIVKLLGLGTEVNLGLISDFKIHIDRILQVKTENRVFGEYYSNSTLGV